MRPIESEQPLKCHRQEDNKWIFKRHFPTEINRNYTWGGKKPNKLCRQISLSVVLRYLHPWSPPLNHTGLNDTSLLWSTWAQVCVLSWTLIAVTRTMWISSQSEDVGKGFGFIKMQFQKSLLKATWDILVSPHRNISTKPIMCDIFD